MPRWTTETRQQQAERIRALCPWKHSTGPRTEEGKARSARNAWKGGIRSTLAHYGKIVRMFEVNTAKLFSSFGRKRVSRPKRTFAPKPASYEPPFLEMDFGLPPNPETDDLSIEELTAMAKRVMQGRGLFSSFGSSLESQLPL